MAPLRSAAPSSAPERTTNRTIPMDSHKIAFVTLSRDPDLLRALATSIRGLRVPAGFSAEHLVKFGATSVTSGYNALMAATDAKYKIYVHDDCTFNEPAFLERVIETFTAHQDLGLLGVCGARRLPANGVWWEGDKVGRVVDLNLGGELKFAEPAGDFEEVEVLDGLVLCSQCDLPWDERIEGFHFYDMSQSIRFRTRGYRVGVLRQERPYLTHAGSKGFDRGAYDERRQGFIALYRRDTVGRAG